MNKYGLTSGLKDTANAIKLDMFVLPGMHEQVRVHESIEKNLCQQVMLGHVKFPYVVLYRSGCRWMHEMSTTKLLRRLDAEQI